MRTLPLPLRRLTAAFGAGINRFNFCHTASNKRRTVPHNKIGAQGFRAKNHHKNRSKKYGQKKGVRLGRPKQEEKHESKGQESRIAFNHTSAIIMPDNYFKFIKRLGKTNLSRARNLF